MISSSTIWIVSVFSSVGVWPLPRNTPALPKQLMKTKSNKQRVNNFFISNTSIFKSTISQVIYHIPQAFTTADYKFSIISCKCRGLWYFQFEANFLRIFQGSSMVIFSVFDSNRRLLFLRILRSKVWFLRIFPQFFIKVFVKVGWEILCFLWHKTENLALLYRVLL